MRKHVEESASFSDKFWTALFDLAILLLPLSQLLEHWGHADAALVVMVVSLVALPVLLLARKKLYGEKLSELALSLVFWGVFALGQFLHIMSGSQPTFITQFYSYAAVGMLLLYTYRRSVWYWLMVIVFIGTPVFTTASENLPRMQLGLTETSMYPFSSEFRVETVLEDNGAYELPLKVALYDDRTMTLGVNNEAVSGTFSEMEGDGEEVWFMIPGNAVNTRYVLEMDDKKQVTLDYQVIVPDETGSHFETQWSVRLSEIESVKFRVTGEDFTTTSPACWYPHGTVYSEDLLANGMDYEQDDAACIILEDDSITELLVTEEYYNGDQVEIRQFTVRKSSGSFLLVEDPEPRFEGDGQYIVYSFELEDGVFFLKLRFDD